jgi:ParB family chromosome partitioning protein
MNEFGLTTSEIAVRIGKSVAYVSNSMRLLSLPDALKDGLLSGLITEGHARALAAIDDLQLMVEAYKIILKKSGSVRMAEELARRMKLQSQQEPKPTARLNDMRVVSEEIDRMKGDLQKVLSVSENDKTTHVNLVRTRRSTKITFEFKGSLEETEERLAKIYSSLTQ